MENQVNIQQVNIDHIQLEGQAFYDTFDRTSPIKGGTRGISFMFSPDDPVAGRVTRYRKQGVAQQMSDGTFDFVAKPQLRPKSTLIKKLTHGRVSKTKDDAIQLTLKVFCNEGINISEAISKEAQEASEAVKDYQLKH